MQIKYGKCECGSNLIPEWFIEEETIVEGTIMYKTGRKRKACSHLSCPNCLKNHCVDDSFDNPFR